MTKEARVKTIGYYLYDIASLLVLFAVIILFYLYIPIEWIRCRIKHVPFRYPFDPEEWD